MLDFAKIYHEDLMIVNSDIIVPTLPPINQHGITILSRYDYSDDIEQAKKFDDGFDVFIIPKNFIEFFPSSIYALGCAWWDYWIPYVAMLKGIPLYYPAGEFAFHKKHPMQYPYEEWVRLGEYFKWEFRFDPTTHPNQIATQTLERINRYLICQPSTS
jgi:hypothetical protein